MSEQAVGFEGEIAAVKGRIRLLRSFDEVSHAYPGYTLVLKGSVDGVPREEFKVAVGPAAHAKHQFRRGDRLRGKAVPVADPTAEWAEYYKASGIKLYERGPESEKRPGDPDGGIAPPLPEYRARGHRRLHPRICETACRSCPFGLTMPTEIVLDKWDQSKVKRRFETHCYGPKDCDRYRPGAARQVPGREPGMVWVDDDVERAADDDAT